MNKILIMTEDLQLARVLNDTLSYNGFWVQYAFTAESALKFLSEIHFDLMLMDFTFNSTNGVEFYHELREMGNISPVVVMGEFYDEVGMIDNMYAGMDDYILKPFSMSELRMIVNKQLERKRFMTKPIVVGDLRIDVARSLVTVKNKIISLGKKEVEILTILAKKAGKLVTKDTLVTEERIMALSKKLRNVAGEAFTIKSEYRGFKLIAVGTCG